MAFLNLSSLLNGGTHNNNNDEGIFLQDGDHYISHEIKAVELPDYMKELSFEVASTFIDGSETDSYKDELDDKIRDLIIKELPASKDNARYIPRRIMESVVSFILYGGGKKVGEIDLRPIIKEQLDSFSIPYEEGKHIESLNSGITKLIAEEDYIKAIEDEVEYRKIRVFDEDREAFYGWYDCDAIVVFDSDEQKMKFVDIEKYENKQEIMDRLAEYLEFASSLVSLFRDTPDIFISGNEEDIFESAIARHDEREHDFDLSELSVLDANVFTLIKRLIEKSSTETTFDGWEDFEGKQLLADIDEASNPRKVLVTNNHFIHHNKLEDETDVCEPFNDDPWVKDSVQKFIDSTFGDADGKFTIDVKAGGDTFTITNPLMSRLLFLVPFSQKDESSKHLCAVSESGKMPKQDADDGIIAKYVIGCEFYSKYKKVEVYKG